jgi:cobaltochelatase CobT
MGMLDTALREWFPIIVAAVLIGLALLYRWYRWRPVGDLPEGTPYKIYTTEYDVEIRAEEIAGRLSEISSDHPKYWRKEGDIDWITAIENAKGRALALSQESSSASLPENLNDVAISLLIDHSGSMKGETMIAVASMAKTLTEALITKGANVELLGYTTAGWQGGFARSCWNEQGRPPYPGRLCALMHIVYKAADDGQLNDAAFEAMLNPGIVYENIDGEAIEWAERRLLARPEQHRILIVISDGAPVDDSTLTQNGPSILWRHVKQVIGRIETEKALFLGAIGINYQVSGFYSNSVAAENLDELPTITADFVCGMIRVHDS